MVQHAPILQIVRNNVIKDVILVVNGTTGKCNDGNNEKM